LAARSARLSRLSTRVVGREISSSAAARLRGGSSQPARGSGTVKNGQNCCQL
jgi:hypothetical protein